MKRAKLTAYGVRAEEGRPVQVARASLMSCLGVAVLAACGTKASVTQHDATAASVIHLLMENMMSTEIDFLATSVGENSV